MELQNKDSIEFCKLGNLEKLAKMRQAGFLSCHIFLFSPSIRWRTAARVNVDVKEPYNFKA